MKRTLLSLACGLAALLGAGTSMASVDDAHAAKRIANKVCGHPGGIQPARPLSPGDWHARLDGDTWRVWTGEEGKGLLVLIPKNGPEPTHCTIGISD